MSRFFPEFSGDNREDPSKAGDPGTIPLGFHDRGMAKNFGIGAAGDNPQEG